MDVNIFLNLTLIKCFFNLKFQKNQNLLTTFYANGRLIRLCRLPQGILPACSKLNIALTQIFSQIPEVYAIHDDILIASETEEEHYIVLEKVFKLLESHNLT